MERLFKTLSKLEEAGFKFDVAEEETEAGMVTSARLTSPSRKRLDLGAVLETDEGLEIQRSLVTIRNLVKFVQQGG